MFLNCIHKLSTGVGKLVKCKCTIYARSLFKFIKIMIVDVLRISFVPMFLMKTEDLQLNFYNQLLKRKVIQAIMILFN